MRLWRWFWKRDDLLKPVYPGFPASPRAKYRFGVAVRDIKKGDYITDKDVVLL